MGNRIKNVWRAVRQFVRWLVGWPLWMYERLLRVFIFLFKHFYVFLSIILIFIVIWVILSQLLPVLYAIDDTGLGAFGDVQNADYQRAKTLWDWMGLLIVPVLLAAIALWFNEQTRLRERTRQNDRFREEALQRYFDGMAELLLKTMNDAAESRHVKDIATMRTTTVLRRLESDSDRLKEVLNFLRDANWLGAGEGGHDSALKNATLTEINLSGSNLSLADLSEADLSEAILSGADLSGAILSNATLIATHLDGADLNKADLSGADLGLADLTDANLDGAIMPDGKEFSADTDLTRFTNPEHPDFWRPPGLDGA